MTFEAKIKAINVTLFQFFGANATPEEIINFSM